MGLEDGRGVAKFRHGVSGSTLCSAFITSLETYGKHNVHRVAGHQSNNDMLDSCAALALPKGLSIHMHASVRDCQATDLHVYRKYY